MEERNLYPGKDGMHALVYAFHATAHTQQRIANVHVCF